MNVKAFVTKYMLILYVVSVILGVIFNSFGVKYELLIPYLVFLLMFFSTYNLKFGQVTDQLKNIKINLLSLAVQFAVFPLAFLLLTIIFFSNNPIIAAGIIFIFTLPSGTTNVLYSNILKGDSSLVLTLLAITSLVSPLITPLVFLLLTKSLIEIGFLMMSVRILLIVVLPFILANLARKINLFDGKNADFYSILLFFPIAFIVTGVFF